MTQEEYKSEGVMVPHIQYEDNRPLLEMLLSVSHAHPARPANIVCKPHPPGLRIVCKLLLITNLNIENNNNLEIFSIIYM